jgi:hypothetical protein
VTARPWRAVAYWPLPGGRRLIARRTARTTADRLVPWLAAAELEGLATDHWEVLPITGIGSAGQVADSHPG